MGSAQRADDGDVMVAELLQQFLDSESAATTRPTVVEPAPETDTQIEDAFYKVEGANDGGKPLHDDDLPAAERKPPLEQSLVAVEVPAITGTEEYEFLPGHFDVRYIISETSDADQEEESTYRVRLRSGEIEMIPFRRFHALKNAKKALEYFNTYGYSESSSLPSSDDEFRSSSSDDQIHRTRRSNRAPGQFTAFFGSDNEQSEDISSDDELVSSLASRRRLRPRKATTRRRRTSASESEDYARKGTRHSTRRRNFLKDNLRDKIDDEISERESPENKGKYYGAKETFKMVPRDDWFRLHHRNICESCHAYGDNVERGPLVFCQGCTTSYHQACLGSRAQRDHLVTKIKDDQFVLQCRFCVGIAHTKDPLCPHQGCCTQCGDLGEMSKPLRGRLSPRQEQQLRQDSGGKDPVTPVDMSRVDKVQNLLFRCVQCRRGFHFEHLPPKTVELLVPEDLMRTRFEEYSHIWKCHDCTSALGEIDVIVAWRPNNSRSVSAGFTASEMKESDKEYLIKWKDKSYYRAAWMPGTWVWGAAHVPTRVSFFKSSKNWNPSMTTEEAIPEEFLRVDIVFDVHYSNKNEDEDDNRTLEKDLARVSNVREAYVKFKALPYEDAVWETPPDDKHPGRWEDFKAAYGDWAWRDYVLVPNSQNLKKHLAEVRKQDFKSMVLDKQPETMTGGEIMDFQKDGMNWLYYMWFKQNNAILADEMGLGKTIQVIGLFAALIQYHKCWPFLVVAPNAACPNWRREIKLWAPSIRVVAYYGSHVSRKLAHDHEMFAEGSKSLACHVVVASYETMVDDDSRRMLSRIPWVGLVVDEGQRLKNDKSQIYASLSRMKIPFRLLLTGTPLQNNIRELLNLLQFCDPSKNAEALESQYETLTKDNIPELHSMIRPFFLRRTKAQVLDFLPPMVQVIVPVSMSVVQKKLYKSILAKNPQLIKAIFESKNVKNGERQNLNNILMQLRKCLCHPFVYSRAIEERTSDVAASHQHLMEASGKLQLLGLMLPKLKERGHRVLIFSQFLENLDVVEDFLTGLGLLYCRLDGSMSSLEKQKKIDEYNAKDSPVFAFLLSTRSGGVGINLATADTVIIMDPDFNPHQDMQALSRAHRIGQKSKVLVFQLMTRASAEEKIMQIGKKKLALDHVLIEKIDEDDVQDLESILRHGAQALFEDDESADVHYDTKSVEKLLDRSQAEQAKPTEDTAASQFSFARVWTNENSALEDKLQDPDKEPSPPNSTVWEKILRERELAAAEEARTRSETLGRGKRKRTTVDYAVADTNESPEKPKPPEEHDKNKSDGAFHADFSEGLDSDEDDPGVVSDDLAEVRPKRQKVYRFQHGKSQMPTPVDRIPVVHCIACNQHHPIGNCRLKRAGVERCGLCGMAHFGLSRTCPSLQSEAEIRKILAAVRQSNEPRELVESARKYLYGVRHDLARKRRVKAAKLAASTENQTGPNAPNTDATIPVSQQQQKQQHQQQWSGTSGVGVAAAASQKRGRPPGSVNRNIVYRDGDGLSPREYRLPSQILQQSFRPPGPPPGLTRVPGRPEQPAVGRGVHFGDRAYEYVPNTHQYHQPTYSRPTPSVPAAYPGPRRGTFIDLTDEGKEEKRPSPPPLD